MIVESCRARRLLRRQSALADTRVRRHAFGGRSRVEIVIGSIIMIISRITIVVGRVRTAVLVVVIFLGVSRFLRLCKLLLSSLLLCLGPSVLEPVLLKTISTPGQSKHNHDTPLHGRGKFN